MTRQVFGRMRSIVFLALTLKLPIQTYSNLFRLSVAPTRSVFWHVTQFQQNKCTPGIDFALPGELPGSVFFPRYKLVKEFQNTKIGIFGSYKVDVVVFRGGEPGLMQV